MGKGRRHWIYFNKCKAKVCVQPDSATFVGVQNACASSKKVGVFMNKSFDMCAKCGSIEDAEKIFNSMVTCDVVLCNMMILGYVKCRQAQKGLGLFQQCEWVQPVATTFVGTLNACASIEALEVGRRDYLESMGLIYSFAAAVECHTCIISLLGCSGCLN